MLGSGQAFANAQQKWQRMLVLREPCVPAVAARLPWHRRICRALLQVCFCTIAWMRHAPHQHYISNINQARCQSNNDAGRLFLASHTHTHTPGCEWLSSLPAAVCFSASALLLLWLLGRLPAILGEQARQLHLRQGRELEPAAPPLTRNCLLRHCSWAAQRGAVASPAAAADVTFKHRAYTHSRQMPALPHRINKVRQAGGSQPRLLHRREDLRKCGAGEGMARRANQRRVRDSPAAAASSGCDWVAAAGAGCSDRPCANHRCGGSPRRSGPSGGGMQQAQHRAGWSAALRPQTAPDSHPSGRCMGGKEQGKRKNKNPFKPDRSVVPSYRQGAAAGGWDRRAGGCAAARRPRRCGRRLCADPADASTGQAHAHPSVLAGRASGATELAAASCTACMATARSELRSGRGRAGGRVGNRHTCWQECILSRLQPRARGVRPPSPPAQSHQHQRAHRMDCSCPANECHSWRSTARCARVGSKAPAMRSQWPGGARADVAKSACMGWDMGAVERMAAPAATGTAATKRDTASRLGTARIATACSGGAVHVPCAAHLGIFRLVVKRNRHVAGLQVGRGAAGTGLQCPCTVSHKRLQGAPGNAWVPAAAEADNWRQPSAAASRGRTGRNSKRSPVRRSAASGPGKQPPIYKKELQCKTAWLTNSRKMR